MTVMAFPGHAGRFWPLTRWRSLARTRDMVHVIATENARRDAAAGDDDQRVADLLDDLLTRFPPATTPQVEFLGAQFDLGLAWVHFAPGDGGLGVSPKFQTTVNARIAAAGGPMGYFVNPLGYGMCGPTVAAWGTDEQRRRYLRPLFTGEEIWCQLFSEPGAGSDFAGLAARGVQDGDEWVVNGQKVWTSLAHVSKFGLLVVRTDPDAVKHAGLTAFVVDMHAPGVEVRPLRQITGDAEFNEVYFTDVRIPATAMLGAPGDGWRVSLTTLMNERVSIGGTIPPKGSGVIGQLLDVWHAHPTGAAQRGRPRRGDAVVVSGRGAAPDQHPGERRTEGGRSRAGGFDRQGGVGHPQQGRALVRRDVARRRRGCCSRATTRCAGRGSRVSRTACSTPSCAAGRTRSRGAPPR